VANAICYEQCLYGSCMSLLRQGDEPHSRRDRPAKPALSRAAITAAALELVRDEGLDAVTLRKVADRLDTGPASLYVYVSNREDLLERMLDEVLAEVPRVRIERRRWQARLAELFSGMLAALDRYPGLGQVGLGSVPSGHGQLAIAENALALLLAGDVPEQSAAWACDALLLYTFAHAAEHSIEHRRVPTAPQHKAPEGDFVTYLRDLFASLPEDRYPHLSRLAVTITTGDDTTRFQYGLKALIRGTLEG
jgi:AcrR family transcriptional regulator